MSYIVKLADLPERLDSLDLILDKIVEGDCLELMRRMPDKCVDAVITDPPYFQPAEHYASRDWTWGRCWGDNSILGSFFGQCLAEHKRTLKEVGSVFYFINDQAFPILFVAGYGIFRHIRLLIWDKGEGHYSLGSGYVFRKRHELIAHLHSPSPFYNEGNRYDVIVHRVVPNAERDHPAEKPETIASILLSASVPGGGLIFDPFLGSGTTAVAAKKLGRHFIGCEISPDYCRIAERRLQELDAQPGLFEKPRQPEQILLSP